MNSILLTDLLKLLHFIIKNIWGTLAHPYLTWQKLRREPHPYTNLIFIFLLCLIFTFRTPLLLGLNAVPLWPRSFAISYLTALSYFFITTASISLITRQITQNQNNLPHIISAWTYSYIPTTIFFFLNQISYYLIPKASPIILGILYDSLKSTTHYYLLIFYTLIYVTLTIYLFLWKLLLLYLTLRITCQLTPPQIVNTLLFLTPILTAYTILLYLLGLSRLPFL